MFHKLAQSVAFDDMQAIHAFREGTAVFAVLFLLYVQLVCVGRRALLWSAGQMQLRARC